MAIIHDPSILILDAPVNGLDPNQIIEIRELIRDLGRDKTIIISIITKNRFIYIYKVFYFISKETV